MNFIIILKNQHPGTSSSSYILLLNGKCSALLSTILLSTSVNAEAASGGFAWMVSYKTQNFTYSERSLFSIDYHIYIPSDTSNSLLYSLEEWQSSLSVLSLLCLYSHFSLICLTISGSLYAWAFNSIRSPMHTVFDCVIMMNKHFNTHESQLIKILAKTNAPSVYLSNE